MSTYIVEEVTQRSELDAIGLFLTTHADEGRHLYFPVNPQDPTASIQEIQHRLWSEHTGDPASHWIFVRDPVSHPDDEGLKIVGACQWRFYSDDPFVDGMPADLTAHWWEEGGGRDFGTEFTFEVLKPRVKWMSRAHSGMSWIAVHNDHRRKGIGSALMAWGMERTDKLGLESYIEGTALGALLYDACGYKIVARVTFNMQPNPDADEIRRKLEAIYVPFGYAVTWRPVRGVWVDSDEQKRMWEDRLKGSEEAGILMRDVLMW